MPERRAAFQQALSHWLDATESKKRRRMLVEALQALPPARGWPSALQRAHIALCHGLQQAQQVHEEGLITALGLFDLAIRDLDEALAERAQHAALMAFVSTASDRRDHPPSEAWPPQLPVDEALRHDPSALVLCGRLGGGHLLISAQRAMTVQRVSAPLSRPVQAPPWMAGHYPWSHRQLVVVDGLARASANVGWLCVVRPPMAAAATVAQFALALDALPSVGRLQDQSSRLSLVPDLAALALEIERSGY